MGGVFLALLSALLLTAVAAQEGNKRYAYATIFYEGTKSDAEYVLGARVMIRSLRQAGTTHDIVILAAQNVKEETKAIFRNDGAIVLNVPNIPNPYKRLHAQQLNAPQAQSQAQAHAQPHQHYQPRFEFTLNKLHLWNLTQYERVVYLDADTIALANPDELFSCGHFCVVFMNPCKFHTGLLVVKPDTGMFNTLLHALHSNSTGSYDGADQGFLTTYFSYKDIGGAPLFDPDLVQQGGALKQRQEDSPLMRLPPGYSLNALWYYEHGNWNLYCCHSRFATMQHQPGLLMTFPVTPFLKPWYWWSYVILDRNWLLWQDIRATLNESHANTVGLTLATLASALLVTVWLLTCCQMQPCALRRSRMLCAMQSLSSIFGQHLGFGVGVLCVGLSCGVPYMLIPGLLPPKWGWFLYPLSMFTLNFIFISLLSSLSTADNSGRAGVKKLLQSTLVSLLPSAVVAVCILAICWFQLYPQTMFHLGKLVLVFQLMGIGLVSQVLIYPRVLNQTCMYTQLRDLEDAKATGD